MRNMNPKKNEKRPAFLKREGEPRDWRMLNSFSFDFEPPEMLTPLIENKSGGEMITATLAGEVMDIEAATAFVTLLGENSESDVHMKINSEGGSVDQGMMMFNAMKSHEGHITTEIIGKAHSTALTIAMGGDTILAHENTDILMHPARALTLMGFVGHTQDGMEQAQFVQEMADKATDQIIDLLSMRSGQSRGKVEKMVTANGSRGTQLTAQEAQKLGFVDEVIETPPRKVQNLKSLQLQAYTRHQLAKARTMELSGLTVLG